MESGLDCVDQTLGGRIDVVGAHHVLVDGFVDGRALLGRQREAVKERRRALVGVVEVLDGRFEVVVELAGIRTSLPCRGR